MRGSYSRAEWWHYLGRREAPSKNSYLTAAAILVAANIIVKLVGALLKIPLSNLFGKEGMGMYNVAYDIYTALFVLSTAGLPVAVSKMISEAHALSNYGEVRRIFRVAMMAFSSIGAFASIVLFFGARVFTSLVGNSMAYNAVLAIAPALFFVSVTSTVRGYYQGLSNMKPTAISQIIEAVLKLVVGYALAHVLLNTMGKNMETAAAGAIAGVTIGALFSALYLIVRRLRDSKREALSLPAKPMRSQREILKTLIKIAIPITIGASVLSVTNLLDTAVVMNRLQDVGFSELEANNLYGAYGMARTLFNLPQTLIAAIAISIIPAISAAIARRDKMEAGKTIESSLRITSMLALPCAAGLGVLARPILNLIYFEQPDDVLIAAPLLSLISASVFFVAMVSITNSVLQGAGFIYMPVVSMLCGGVIKLITNYALVGTEGINISGAPIGTTLCYGVITVMNLIFIARLIKMRAKFIRIVAAPVISAVVMGVFCYLIYPPIEAILSGSRIAVLPVIVLAAVLYLLCLILLGGLRKSDILLLPKGEKIVHILKIK